MRQRTPGIEVTTERLLGAGPVLRARADELARIRADAARALRDAGDELAGLRTGVALDALGTATGHACDRLVLALDGLAAAMEAAARCYVDVDNLGR